MLFKRIVFASSLALAPFSAFAACPNQVTAITTQAGGSAVHVTVDDQNCNPIPPANLSFALGSPLTGIVAVTADATGFNMDVSNVNQAATSGFVTFTNTANGVHAALSVSVTAGGVTALNFTSP